MPKTSKMTITPEMVEAAMSRLRSLPEKPKAPRPLSQAEAVKQMKVEISAVLKRGNTFEDVVRALKGEGDANGIDIAIPTLKSYLYKKTKRNTLGRIYRTTNTEVANPASGAQDTTSCNEPEPLPASRNTEAPRPPAPVSTAGTPVSMKPNGATSERRADNFAPRPTANAEPSNITRGNAGDVLGRNRAISLNSSADTSRNGSSVPKPGARSEQV